MYVMITPALAIVSGGSILNIINEIINRRTAVTRYDKKTALSIAPLFVSAAAALTDDFFFIAGFLIRITWNILCPLYKNYSLPFFLSFLSAFDSSFAGCEEFTFAFSISEMACFCIGIRQFLLLPNSTTTIWSATSITTP